MTVVRLSMAAMVGACAIQAADGTDFVDSVVEETAGRYCEAHAQCSYFDYDDMNECMYDHIAAPDVLRCKREYSRLLACVTDLTCDEARKGLDAAMELCPDELREFDRCRDRRS